MSIKIHTSNTPKPPKNTPKHPKEEVLYIWSCIAKSRKAVAQSNVSIRWGLLPCSQPTPEPLPHLIDLMIREPPTGVGWEHRREGGHCNCKKKITKKLSQEMASLSNTYDTLGISHLLSIQIYSELVVTNTSSIYLTIA